MPILQSSNLRGHSVVLYFQEFSKIANPGYLVSHISIIVSHHQVKFHVSHTIFLENTAQCFYQSPDAQKRSLNQQKHSISIIKQKEQYLSFMKQTMGQNVTETFW